MAHQGQLFQSMLESSMKTQVKVFPSSDPTIPSLVLHVIHLVDSYMLWIGISSSSDPNDAQGAILNGSLCRDWACAMPPRMSGLVGGCDSYSLNLIEFVSIQYLQHRRLCSGLQAQMLHCPWRTV